jgi:hypothetical protein
MKQEFHLDRIRESLEMIADSVTKGAATHQRTIGFHASAASLDLLHLYLFEKKLITAGTQLQHQWFRSQKRAREALSFDFQEKDRVIQLLYYIEKARDTLCYGRPCPMEQVREVLDHFNQLREIFRSLGVHEPDEA